MIENMLFGNESLKETLRGFASKNAFPNAFIISGPEGSGKNTAAHLFAMAISCKGAGRPCGNCPSCRKISENISPDVIEIGLEKDRKTLGIETVRAIRDTAYVLPNDLDVKVYIIKDADKLTDQAQNALLKIFEEGPGSVYFILLSSNPLRLLPTVRSRAPELKTEVFTEYRLEALLEKNVPKASELKKRDPEAFKRIINASGGSYGRALALIEGKSKKSIQIYSRVEALILSLSQRNKADILVSLLFEASERENYCLFLSLLQSALRDLASIKKGADADLCFFANNGQAEELSKSFSLSTLISLYNVSDTLLSEMSSTNINLRHAAIVASGRLSERL